MRRNLKIWLLLGGLFGLIAAVLLDVLLEVPPTYLRLAQLAMVALGALVAAFVYEGARLVTDGREPARSTNRTRPGVVVRERRPRA